MKNLRTVPQAQPLAEHVYPGQMAFLLTPTNAVRVELWPAVSIYRTVVLRNPVSGDVSPLASIGLN